MTSYDNLIGEVIRQAIVDYQSEYTKKNRYAIWADARRFLFKEGELEAYLDKYYSKASADYIRRKVLTFKIERQGRG